MTDKVKIGWNAIELVCGICGGKMEVVSGPWGIFYSCGKYPECFNRMNVGVYDSIIDKIAEKLSEDPEMNWTGYTWKHKTSYQSYVFEIKRHRPNKITVAVINPKKYKQSNGKEGK